MTDLNRSGGAVTDDSAKFVAVAGMFIAPDQVNNTWRIVIARDELDPDKARVIEAGDNRLTLKATGSE